MSTATSVAVETVGEELTGERLRELLRGRSSLSRLRGLVGATAESVQLERTLYWPVALVHATARGTGRHGWTERCQGAVDLVSGRVGLVDLDLPQTQERPVRSEDCIPARVPRGVAELRWHEFFRDHVDRRRKPLRPPALSVDRIAQVWLPSHLVTAGARPYLVDALTGRVDALADFPYVEDLLAGRDHHPVEGETTCKA